MRGCSREAAPRGRAGSRVLQTGQAPGEPRVLTQGRAAELLSDPGCTDPHAGSMQSGFPGTWPAEDDGQAGWAVAAPECPWGDTGGKFGRDRALSVVWRGLSVPPGLPVLGAWYPERWGREGVRPLRWAWREVTGAQGTDLRRDAWGPR